MVWSRRRGSVAGFAFGLTLASGAQAVVARDPPCTVWVDEDPITPFLDAVPIEGELLLPFVLENGTSTSPSGKFGDPPIVAQVFADDGTPMPGYVSMVVDPIGAGTSGIHAEWISSRTLVAGARYHLEVDAQNFPECEPYAHLMAAYDFVVADKTLPERVKDALPEVESVSLDWTRMALSPQCCVARDTTRCTDPAHCFACTKSMVTLNVVVPVTPPPASAYLVEEVLLRTPSSTNTPSTMAVMPGATEVRLQSKVCETEYCASLRISSPLTDDSTESEELCIPGSDPMILPEANGAEIVPGDPCAEGSAGSFRAAAPPVCQSYPEVRWFDDVVAGYVAVGLTQSQAEAQARASGTGAFGGMGGSGGTGATSSGGGTGATPRGAPANGSSTVTHQSGCSLVGNDRTNASSAALVWLGAALVGLCHRRRRQRRS